MLEAEVAEAIVAGVREGHYAGNATEFSSAEFGETVSENAGFTITFDDGEKFLVTVTRIEEGQ